MNKNTKLMAIIVVVLIILLIIAVIVSNNKEVYTNNNLGVKFQYLQSFSKEDMNGLEHETVKFTSSNKKIYISITKEEIGDMELDTIVDETIGIMGEDAPIKEEMTIDRKTAVKLAYIDEGISLVQIYVVVNQRLYVLTYTENSEENMDGINKIISTLEFI